MNMSVHLCIFKKQYKKL